VPFVGVVAHGSGSEVDRRTQGPGRRCGSGRPYRGTGATSAVKPSCPCPYRAVTADLVSVNCLPDDGSRTRWTAQDRSRAFLSALCREKGTRRCAASLFWAECRTVQCPRLRGDGDDPPARLRGGGHGRQPATTGACGIGVRWRNRLRKTLLEAGCSIADAPAAGRLAGQFRGAPLISAADLRTGVRAGRVPTSFQRPRSGRPVDRSPPPGVPRSGTMSAGRNLTTSWPP